MSEHRASTSAAPTLAPYAPAFGLVTHPFPVTPDETNYFFTPAIEAIYEEVRHFIEMRKGFLLLTGEIGLGKTTLLRRLLTSFDPTRVNTALLLTSFLDSSELLESVARDFGLHLAPQARRIDHLNALNDFLLAQSALGKINVLFIDDAQALDADALDVVRQLSNLETAQTKLIQVVLCGQPELLVTLDQYSLRQVKSRIALQRQLLPLSAEQTLAYIGHRITSACGISHAHGLHITPQGLAAIQACTEGFPRRIHHLLDRCLYALMGQAQRQIDPALVSRAALDLGWPAPPQLIDDSPETSPELLAAAPSPAQAQRAHRSWAWAWAGGLALAASASAAVALAYFDLWDEPGSASVQASLAPAPFSPPVDTKPAADSPAAAPAPAAPAAVTRAPAQAFIPAPPQWSSRVAYTGLAQLDWPQAPNLPELTQALARAVQPHPWQLLMQPGEPRQECAARPLQRLTDERGAPWHFGFVESTWPTSPVALGQPSPSTPLLQKVLVAKNLMEASQVDGVMGPRTVLALARFQQSHQLPGTGQFDPATAYRLSCQLALGLPTTKGLGA